MSERRLAHRGVRPQRRAWVGDVDPLRRYVEETKMSVFADSEIAITRSERRAAIQVRAASPWPSSP
jgi:hypothetical protein